MRLRHLLRQYFALRYWTLGYVWCSAQSARCASRAPVVLLPKPALEWALLLVVPQTKHASQASVAIILRFAVLEPRPHVAARMARHASQALAVLTMKFVKVLMVPPVARQPNNVSRGPAAIPCQSALEPAVRQLKNASRVLVAILRNARLAKHALRARAATIVKSALTQWASAHVVPPVMYVYPVLVAPKLQHVALRVK
ncbi:hypothetical protein N7510_003740 [Penicillium lagena]|uniref:uncharacterized protein n=1 Tax=Penicillium lagena TaxID=94218 RepID=UPI002540B393|nr:uncharacterized protein N7510_003740 [Penicillium lagena]KAJ5619756.1 hypothetical protein N7510_003740 [Penicillium lagena]